MIHFLTEKTIPKITFNSFKMFFALNLKIENNKNLIQQPTESDMKKKNYFSISPV